MSVYESRRKESHALFITATRDFRITTIRICKKFPKSYQYTTTNRLLEMAQDIYLNCVKGNSVYVHQDTMEEDYATRRKYLQIALYNLEAMLAEISFTYALINQGNNFYKKQEDYNKDFSRWVEEGNEALRLLKSIIDSDTKRYKK